ncbi:efflux RND transporter periplasmic adaptor subunit [Mucilaginibacter straminoryzae]|uniref:efflux RND transporter periplasmic adaptor subunit n=1 Tax=Mucilaginibacter straminoryzae TaxID=2932774 RepID=UPI001FD6B0D9|nr:efflux RND transporter periplasmic adaptor subunit [Mucilaginibacter straminoryzae]
MLACSSKKDNQQEAGQSQQAKSPGNSITFNTEQYKNGGIDTGKLPSKELVTEIHVTGKVDVPPQNIVSVNVPMGGFLKGTGMLPGRPVRKGQVIAQIENQDYITIQQDYLTAVSRMAFLKQELDRQRELSRQQASPLKLYQQTQADYNSEQAQAAGMAQKLRLLGINPQKLNAGNIRSVINIIAPISGFVSQVFANVGKYVNPSDVLMELVSTDDIHAALTVYEQDIPKIKIGSKVNITLPSIPDKTYPGEVILIGRMLDTSHSVLVHCHFLKADQNLLPNMFLQASIRTKPHVTQVLPDEALVNYEGKDYAFLASKQNQQVRFNMVPVTIGAKQGGWNEVNFNKPEFAQQTLVLKGAFAILSAMKNAGGDE